MYEMASDPQYKDELGKEEIRIENELEMLEKKESKTSIVGKSKLLDFSTMPTITESHAYIYPILLYQAQKSIPCLGNKYYNKAIDNRN